MIKRLFMLLGIMTLVASATATPAYAAACNTRFFTFPAWYDGLTKDNSCELKPIGQQNNSLRNFIVRIVLNITEIVLQIVAYAALIFVIIGGFKYMTSAGSSDGMASAKNTIMNALIGLVISLFSVAIVNAAGGLF